MGFFAVLLSRLFDVVCLGFFCDQGLAVVTWWSFSPFSLDVGSQSEEGIAHLNPQDLPPRRHGKTVAKMLTTRLFVYYGLFQRISLALHSLARETWVLLWRNSTLGPFASIYIYIYIDELFFFVSSFFKLGRETAVGSNTPRRVLTYTARTRQARGKPYCKSLMRTGVKAASALVYRRK